MATDYHTMIQRRFIPPRTSGFFLPHYPSPQGSADGTEFILAAAPGIVGSDAFRGGLQTRAGHQLAGGRCEDHSHMC